MCFVEFSVHKGVTVKAGQTYPPPPPQDSINELVIRKLNPLLVVDFRLILHA